MPKEWLLIKHSAIPAQESSLPAENTQHLKSELSKKEAELQRSIRYIQSLRALVLDLQTQIQQKDRLLQEKEEVLSLLNDQMARFSKEMDAIIGYFNISHAPMEEAQNQAGWELLRSSEFAQGQDLLFGVNIDDRFLQTGAVETIKYYLYAIGCTESVTFPLDHLVLKNHQEYRWIGRALAEYLRLKSDAQGQELQGVVQMLPPDIFHTPALRFWGNAPTLAAHLISQFASEYRLEGELTYTVLADEATHG